MYACRHRAVRIVRGEARWDAEVDGSRGRTGLLRQGIVQSGQSLRTHFRASLPSVAGPSGAAAGDRERNAGPTVSVSVAKERVGGIRARLGRKERGTEQRERQDNARSSARSAPLGVHMRRCGLMHARRVRVLSRSSSHGSRPPRTTACNARAGERTPSRSGFSQPAERLSICTYGMKRKETCGALQHIVYWGRGSQHAD
jgi:hypothetical protein